mmetsp:Transcript_10517/g.12000  ORF Transcript_10517/g.12000 Transcript_10517/m.12000 type:complete len:246 (-) Transcript_10517:122-859(-)
MRLFLFSYGLSILLVSGSFFNTGMQVAAQNDSEISTVTKKYPSSDLDLVRSIPALKLLLENTGPRETACWKDAYGRGVGKVIRYCDKGLEESGLLCYKPCRESYEGVGPVCWETCKQDYKDMGVFCYKSSSEMYTKKSYGRGVGKPLECDPEREGKPDPYTGLCYPKCKRSWIGVGPVCWRECDCHPGEPCMFSAGALCCRTKTMCSKEVFDMTINLPIEIAKAVMDYKDPVKEIRTLKRPLKTF